MQQLESQEDRLFPIQFTGKLLSDFSSSSI